MSDINPQNAKNLQPLTLRTNFSWTLVGNIVYAFSQWGMLVAIAKLGSPEMLGQFTLGLAITAPVIMFTNFQLRAVQATDAKQEYLFEDYLGLRLVTTSFAILVIVSIALLAGYRWETSLVAIVLGLAKAVESISDVFYGLIQQHERMDRLAISMIIKGPLSLLFLSIGVYLTHSILWGSVGLLIAWTIVLASYDMYIGVLILHESSKALENKIISRPTGLALLKLNWQWNKIGKLVWLALPLGFVMMLISLNTNIPRYFIERYLGERELGFFAAISYLMVAGGMVITALGQSATPRLAQYYASGKTKDFCRLLIKLLLIGVLLGISAVLIAAIAGREILTFLYSPEYAQYMDLFVWIMVAAGIGFVASFLGYGLTAFRDFWILMPLFVFVTGISTIACFWLVPSLGLHGVAIALIIGAIAQTVFSLLLIAHEVYKLDNKYVKNNKHII